MDRRYQILGAIAVIAVVAALLLFSSSHAFAAIGVPQGGATLLSLSHVQVSGVNQQNFSGLYWFATLLVNGGSQTLTSFSQTSAQIAQATSGFGANLTGNGQTDAFNIQVLKNQLIYPAEGGFGQFSLYTYSLIPFYGSFSFTNCNGQTVIASGQQVATATTGCFTGSQQAVQSYVAACKVATTAQGSGYAIPVTGFGGANGGLTCYFVKRNLWATLFQLSGPNWNQQVSAQINGEKLTVNTSNQYATHLNSSGKVDFALALIPPALGQSSAWPTPQTMGSLYVPSNQTQPQLLTSASFSNLQGVGSNSTAQYQTITSCENSVSSVGTFSNCPANVTSSLLALNNQLSGKLLVQPKSTYNGQVAILNTSGNLQIVLNDPNYNYLTPQAQIVSGLPDLGLQIAKASCSIVSVSNLTFNSGASGVVSVTVKNTGPVAGSCTATVSKIPAPFATQTGQQQQMISSGQTYAFPFTISSTQLLNNTSYGLSTLIQVKSCDLATGTYCTYANASVKENPVCNSGSTEVNGSNCKPLTSITVPTTTVSCTSPSCPVTTTIPVTITCQAPSIFNQTLYNQDPLHPCWDPPNGYGFGIGWYVVAVLVIGVIGYQVYANRKAKRNVSSRKRR